MTSPVVDQVAVAVVPDFRRFPAEMRRGVDEAMREFATRVDLAMQDAERAVSEAGRELGHEFQRGGETAERAMRELDLTASRSLDSVQHEAIATAATLRAVGVAGGTAGAGIVAGMTAASGALLGVTAVVGAGLAAITGFGLMAAAKMEQTQVQFSSLLGSAEEGKRILQELQHFAAETPFELLDITPVAARFFNLAQTLGMAKTQVVEFLNTLGNIASITGGGAFAMERVAFAMGQIASKGRLAAQDINQIGDALVGFPVREKLAAELGLSVAETMKRMEDGSINASVGLQALMRAMEKYPGAAGAMKAQSQTLIGLFSTFKDEINLAMIDAFAPVIPDIKKALADLTPIIGTALTKLAPALGGALSALMPLLGQLVTGFAPAIVPAVESFTKAMEGLAKAGTLEQIGLALAEVMEAAGPNLDLFMEFAVVMLRLLVPALKALEFVLRVTSPTVEVFAASIHELNRAINAINWGEVGQAIGDFFAKIGDLFSRIPGVAGEKFTEMNQIVVARIIELGRLVMSIPGRILDALAGLGELLVDKGQDLVRGFWAGIRGMGGWLYQQVKRFVLDNTVGAVKDVLGIGSPSRVMADQVGRWIPAGIGAGVQDATPELRTMLAGLIPAGQSGAGGGSAAGAGVVLGAGAVVVNFSGAMPTKAQAYDTGIQVGQGIMDAIGRRGVATAARQRS